MSGTVFVNQCTGKSPFNIGNSNFAELSDFGIEGNGLTGASGNSHAITLIDPTFNSGADFRPQYAKLFRLWIYQHRGTAKDYAGSSWANGACGVYGANALNCYIEQCYIVDCAIGAYFYTCFQPKFRETTIYSCDYSGLVDHLNEKPDVRDCDLVDNDSLSGGSITLHGALTQLSGSVVTRDSWGTSVTGCKIKSHHYAGVSVYSKFFPLIENNWIRLDESTSSGVYTRTGARILANTFWRVGPFSGTRYDIQHVMGGGLNDIGEVRGNVFAYSTSADVAAFLLIDGSAAAATMRGVVHDNRFGSPDAPGAATNVTDAVKVTGPAGYLSFQRNVVLAPGSGANKVTITTAFNFAGTETANLDFQNNPILADGTGVITNHVAGLTAPFSTNGNTVDSSTMRFRRPALYGSKTFDWADLATATQQSTTVTVTGAAAGMAAIAYMDVALSGTRLWAEVTAADTLTVYQRNDTGGNVNVGSGMLFAQVEIRPF